MMISLSVQANLLIFEKENDAFFSLSDIYLHIININLIYAKALIPCKNQLFGLVYK